jgi:sodium/potassium-transporting ATPase subunit alpha
MAKPRTLTLQPRATIEDIKNTWSSQGKRVILLARRTLSKEHILTDPSSSQFEDEVMRHARTDLTLVGIVGIVDPPRDEIPYVVSTLRGAGIRIFMVCLMRIYPMYHINTYRSLETLASLLKQSPPNVVLSPTLRIWYKAFVALSRDDATSVSLSDEKNGLSESPQPCRSIVLSGPELITLNDNQWDQLCKHEEIVFARTTPEQKLRIVKEFQARDEIVGMTGDGVNDAPSLKAADIGIALGSGSDIAIEAADMVLLESFSAVVEAVQYGRVVFDNLKKTIAYLLPAGSFSEFWLVMTNVIFGLPQVLSSFLMIIIW